MSTVIKNAKLSDCGTYRYWLSRQFTDQNYINSSVLFVMLNPSTADAYNDDPTIRRCMGFAKSWGCHGLTVANLYAYRATKPANLWESSDPTGGWLNDKILCDLMCGHSYVVCAWGVNAKAERVEEFKKLAKSIPLYCLGTTKNGSPRHPLYVKSDQRLIPWGKS